MFLNVVRYSGELSVDAVTDWFSTTILGLPRIMYYTKESLVIIFIHFASHLTILPIFVFIYDIVVLHEVLIVYHFTVKCKYWRGDMFFMNIVML